ncbi:MAG: murein hydrolase activator EnvC family protein, partial [Bacteroidota bacterium]
MYAGRGLLLLTVLVLVFQPLYSQKSQKNKGQLQKEKQQNLEKIKETERILEETARQKKNSLGELNALKQRITQQEILIQSIKSEINLLEGDIDENQDIIYSLELDLKKLKDEYAAMLFSAQKANGKIDQLTFLFSAQSFDQLLLRLRYMEQYSKARKDQAEAITKAQSILEGQVLKTETIKRAKGILLSDELAENKNLETLKGKQNTLVRTLQKEEKKLRKDIEETKLAVAQLDRMIEEIVREEIARAEREAREAREAKSKASANAAKASEAATIALSASFEENKAKFPWPAAGFISQKFGKQNHPVLKGIVIQNEGINIQTKQDEKVRCIFNGEVRRVAQIGVLGNTVIVNHGEYFSVYSGLREVMVKQG